MAHLSFRQLFLNIAGDTTRMETLEPALGALLLFILSPPLRGKVHFSGDTAYAINMVNRVSPCLSLFLCNC